MSSNIDQIIKIKILDKDFIQKFKLPAYETEESAGLDLRACIKDKMAISPNHVELIPTGFAMHIDDRYVASVLAPRSGLGHKQGIILGNSIGLIDSDYQGELFISCWNRSEIPIQFSRGDRIAQMFFVPIIRTKFEIVNSFDETERGKGGFGHSGNK